jgi:hypothetical protein
MSFPIILILIKFCHPMTILNKIKKYKTKIYMKKVEKMRMKDIGRRPMCLPMSEETNLSVRQPDYSITLPDIQTPSTGVKIVIIDTTQHQEQK